MAVFSRFIYWLILMLGIASGSTVIAADHVGVRHLSVASGQRAGGLDMTIWYPATEGGEPVLLGDSIFFSGVPSALNAPIVTGKFPLILLSHGAGLGGSAQAMSWMATPLAQRGFIVVAPTHPGNAGPNRSASETMKLWLRPVDLTDALNAMQTDALFREHSRFDRVGVLGLSMGGGTALMMTGARLDPERFAAYCDTGQRNASLCEWVRQSGLDLHKMDLQPAGRDYRDQRIRFAMAIDPVPIDVIAGDSFKDITTPVTLVNLGPPGKIPQTALASDIAKAIPDATYTLINDASHYSLFGECKPHAADIAKEEQIGEPICTDGSGRSRHAIHDELVQLVSRAFERALHGVQ
ncbi:dienelactone hydrolase [Hahella aquimaris]|uniref:alpha/beta hydrolase family protein n=1 Tax=Hahella sp. HNIBRBA332 TaxID=3015983 RepID=UPI00273BC39C|nr:alpha/beta fold hydrolase [Hahella sp. HNIBRBA332]WLQ15947.1 dienelactone hydrolase [Hahella sp. HNIBRBA332]